MRNRSISSPPLAAFRSRSLRRTMSNRGLNSNEALEESTSTNSSVRLSGIRRLKEAVIALDIKDYSTERRKRQRTRARGLRSEIGGQPVPQTATVTVRKSGGCEESDE